MDLKILSKELIADEGLKLTPYYCTEGFLTVGIGHNLDANKLTLDQRRYLNYQESTFEKLKLTEAQAIRLLGDDVKSSLKGLRHIFKDFDGFEDDLQHILINLFHQLGYSRFYGFKDLIRAIKRSDFKDAGAELRDSKLWRKDTPARAERLAKRLETL